ncbi:MAG TPA: twin-arginine translocase TatA/TatE family subunit [Chloroflexota bacterium]|nr:twin-arginine translocase TatA/TatE family subunit [Chloroflexota bacterium]
MFSGTFSHAPELIILLIIALVIFGPKKLPDLGKGLGQGIKEFRRATTGEEKPAEAEKQGESALPEHIAQSSAVATPAVPPEPVAPPAPAVPAENHQSPASAPAKAE